MQNSKKALAQMRHELSVDCLLTKSLPQMSRKRALEGTPDPPREEEEEYEESVATAKKKRRGKSEAKVEYNKLHSYSSVPMKLNAILDMESIIGKKVFELLNAVSFNMTRIAHDAHILADLHLRRLIGSKKEIPKLSQTFFKRCCTLVSDSSSSYDDAELMASAVEFYSLRPADFQRPTSLYMSHSMEEVAKTMKTEVTNHIGLNFTSRLEKYVKMVWGLKRDKAREFVEEAFTDPQSDDQRQLVRWLRINPYPKEEEDEGKRKGKRRRSTKPGKNPVSDNLQHFIKKSLDLLRCFEAYVHEVPDDNEKKIRVKLFNLLPKTGKYQPSFIAITTSVLVEILKLLDRSVQCAIGMKLCESPLLSENSLKFIKGKVEAASRLESRSYFPGEFHANDSDIPKALWQVIFKTEPFETVHRKFDCELRTNGYGVSLQMLKPKDKVRENHGFFEFDSVPDDFSGFETFIGIDPGRNYTVSSYSGDEINGKSVCKQVSTVSYREVSKTTDFADWDRRRREVDSAYVSSIESIESFKTADLTKFRDAIGTVNRVSMYLFEYGQSHRFRKWRFTRQVFDRKALKMVVDKVLGDKPRGDPSKVCIGFGDWSNPLGVLKGGNAGPVKKIKQELRHHATVIRIREYNTSQVCSNCNHELKTKKLVLLHKEKSRLDEGGNKVEDEGKKVKCHEVVRCRNNECAITWQRDVNASRNIYDLLLHIRDGKDRPAVFCRPKRKSDPTQS